MPWKEAYLYERKRAKANKFAALVDEVAAVAGGGGTAAAAATVDTGGGAGASEGWLEAQWARRLDQAAWLGTMHDNGDVSHPSAARIVVLNIARAHPAHVVANFTTCDSVHDIDPSSAQVCRALPRSPVLLSLSVTARTVRTFVLAPRVCSNAATARRKLLRRARVEAQAGSAPLRPR